MAENDVFSGAGGLISVMTHRSSLPSYFVLKLIDLYCLNLGGAMICNMDIDLINFFPKRIKFWIVYLRNNTGTEMYLIGYCKLSKIFL